MAKPKILVFASGTEKDGGSGFQMMYGYTQTSPPVLDAIIVAVVSNYENGGVAQKAEKVGITHESWKGPFTASGYKALVEKYQADYVMLSGWLKPVTGLDPRRTINIHPGPLPQFGGHGMYGHFVHEAVVAAFNRGEIKQSAVTMHFVTEKYDEGPIFFEQPVPLFNGDKPEDVAARVNAVEHAKQAKILNLVVHAHIECLPDEKGGWRVHFRNPYLRRILQNHAGENGSMKGENGF